MKISTLLKDLCLSDPQLRREVIIKLALDPSSNVKEKHKPGDVWKTKGGWRGLNYNNQAETFDARKDAVAFAKGEPVSSSPQKPKRSKKPVKDMNSKEFGQAVEFLKDDIYSPKPNFNRSMKNLVEMEKSPRGDSPEVISIKNTVFGSVAFPASGKSLTRNTKFLFSYLKNTESPTLQNYHSYRESPPEYSSHQKKVTSWMESLVKRMKDGEDDASIQKDIREVLSDPSKKFDTAKDVRRIK